jgi:hypothetical protein
MTVRGWGTRLPCGEGSSRQACRTCTPILSAPPAICTARQSTLFLDTKPRPQVAPSPNLACQGERTHTRLDLCRAYRHHRFSLGMPSEAKWGRAFDSRLYGCTPLSFPGAPLFRSFRGRVGACSEQPRSHDPAFPALLTASSRINEPKSVERPRPYFAPVSCFVGSKISIRTVLEGFSPTTLEASSTYANPAGSTGTSGNTRSSTKSRSEVSRGMCPR